MSLRINHGKLLKNLRKDAKENKLAAVSRRLKIPYMTLSDIISNKTNDKGTIRTWLKIEDHYSGRNR
jgi:hypothetical protein